MNKIMRQFAVVKCDTQKSFSLPETKLPVTGAASANCLMVKLYHWEGAPLDMSIDVSYDNGASWHHGGGCKGAVSEPEMITFDIVLQQPPTHIRADFSSSEPLYTHAMFFVGEE